MRARRVADHANAIRVETEIACAGAHELHRRLAIADHAGPRLHTRFHQSVLDREDRVTVLGEVITPMPVEFAVPKLPAAAMRGDQHRHFIHALGPIKVAEQLYAVVFGEKYVRLYYDFVLDRHRLPFSAPETIRRRRGAAI